MEAQEARKSNGILVSTTLERENRLKVMIVDDHATLRDSLSTALNFCPTMEVIGEAGDGNEAIHLARELIPDVILMDINMPDLDGLEATRIIHSEFKDICIIGMSVNNEDCQVEAMMNSGASAFWQKGESIDHLLFIIRDYFDRQLVEFFQTGC